MNIIRTLLSALLLAPVLSLTAEEAPTYDDEIPVDKAVIVWNDKLGVVTFPHADHSALTDVECTTCHHTLEVTQVVKTCAECHGAQPAEVAGFEGIAVKWEDAYHKKCNVCHQNAAAAGQEAGPVKCLTCHVPRG